MTDTPLFLGRGFTAGKDLLEPFVLLDGDKFRMFMRCGRRDKGTLCTATSVKGESWKMHSDFVLKQPRYPKKPVFTAGGFGSPHVVLSQGVYHVWFTHTVVGEFSGTNRRTSSIRYISSADPTDLGQEHLLMVFRAKQPWMDLMVSAPSITGSGSHMEIVFTGGSSAGIGRANGQFRPRAAEATEVSKNSRTQTAVTSSDVHISNGGNGFTTVKIGSVEMSLAPLPAGQFMMGSQDDVEGRDPDELYHSVVISNGFKLGVTEVTQAQYLAVMGTNPSP